MRIGVDARLLSQPVTGIGRYTHELSQAFLRLGAELVLYAPEPILVGDWKKPNVILRESRMRGRVARMLWSQTVLPYQASKDDLDIFWGPTHRLPRYLPKSLPRVVTIHDLVWRFAGETMRPLSRYVEKRLMPEAVKMADKILVDSMSTGKDLKSVFPESEKKSHVIYLGASNLADPGKIYSLNKFGIKKPYFLFVGTLEPRKNLLRLLRAYASISNELRNNFQFVIAGGKGWGEVDVPKILNQLGLDSSQVCVTGYVSDAELSTLYAHSRFLAMPSLYEGFGIPLIEAMSFGVPVMTSNSSSLPEVAGNAGILVDPLNEEEMAKAICIMFSNEAIYKKLKSNSSLNIKRFSWEKSADQALAIFSKVIESKREKR